MNTTKLTINALLAVVACSFMGAFGQKPANLRRREAKKQRNAITVEIEKSSMMGALFGKAQAWTKKARELKRTAVNQVIALAPTIALNAGPSVLATVAAAIMSAPNIGCGFSHAFFDSSNDLTSLDALHNGLYSYSA